MSIHYRDMGGGQRLFGRRQESIRYVTVTRVPDRISQVLYFTKQYNIPTIEIIKDGETEEVQVMQEHLSLAKKMAGL